MTATAAQQHTRAAATTSPSPSPSSSVAAVASSAASTSVKKVVATVLLMMLTTTTMTTTITTILLLLASAPASAYHHIRSPSPPPPRHTIFPGPVTPDRTCPIITTAAAATPRVPKEPSPEMLGQFGAWVARASSPEPSSDPRVLLLQSAASLVKNRGFFFSSLFQTTSAPYQFRQQPGFLYHYLSAASALTSSPDALAGAGVFFDSNCSYPNWYRTMYFNQTFPRFAPRATRQSTPDLLVKDLGALASYTSPQWGQKPHLFTTNLQFRRQSANGGVSDVSVVAPSYAEMKASDVYYDCAHGNRFLWTVSFPAAEIMARYSAYHFLREPKYVAMATADVDVTRLMAGLPAEVPGDVTPLTFDLQCPHPAPAAPASAVPSQAFFRSLFPQSRLALRLAHSLSAFLQTLGPVTTELDYANNGITYAPYDPFPDTASARIKADLPLNDSVLEAEVLANVLADSKVMASGIYFQADGGPRKAFRATTGASGLKVADLSSSSLSSSSSSPPSGLNPVLDAAMLAAWQKADTDPRLRTQQLHAHVRLSKAGGGLEAFAIDPLKYRAVALADGYWSIPYYLCDGDTDHWVVTYAAPFFGPSTSEPGKLTLRGTVTVDIAITEANWRV